MRNRFLKHFIFGIFYLLIFSFIGWEIFNLSKPIPSCFDNKLNGDELEIDCGGSCIACEIKNSSGLKVSDKKIIPAGDNLYSIIFTIENPLAEYALPDFTYQIIGFDSFGNETLKKSGNSFIYSGQSKYIIEPALKSTGQISAFDIKINDTKWASKSEFKEPKIQSLNTKTSLEGNFIVVSGLLINKESSSFSDVVVDSFFYDKNGSLVGASRTFVEKIESFEEKNFYLSYPVVNANLDKTSTFVYAKRLGAFVSPYEINPLLP